MSHDDNQPPPPPQSGDGGSVPPPPPGQYGDSGSVPPPPPGQYGDSGSVPPPAADNPYASSTPPPYSASQPQGDTYGGYGAAPVQQTGGTNVSAIVLTVLAGLATVSCYFTLAGLPALVFGIIALTKQSSDPAGSRKMAKIGWIVFGVLVVLIVILLAVGITAFINSPEFQQELENAS